MVNNIALSDRNGQVKTHHHTISDNQYAMRWHNGDAKFLELIETFESTLTFQEKLAINCVYILVFDCVVSTTLILWEILLTNLPTNHLEIGIN